MKKKAIEKIGFLGLPGTRKDKKVKFIGVTAVKVVAHEKHFFLEIYRNDEAAREIPVIRIVLTKKDFGTYRPEDGSWTRAKLVSGYDENLIWEEGSSYYRDRGKQNLLHSPEDLSRLKRFFRGEKVWKEEYWWNYIRQAQNRIACSEKEERLRRKHEKRQQAIKDRLEHTPELPEQEMLSWADRKLFLEKHLLYYRKKGRKAVVCCSACGGVGEGAWKAGMSYESQFERRIEEPREGHFGLCPMCGACGLYKPQGRAEAQSSIKAHAWKADRYKENGAVIRYIQFEKLWALEEIVDENGKLAMHGAYEKLEAVEIARTYLHEGAAQTDFQKHDYYTGEDFWDDCNLSGLSNITVGEAPLYPGFMESLKGTAVQYSAIGLYAAVTGKVNARDYLERYQQTPQIEMLVKLKLYGVVEELLRFHYGIIVNEDADRPEDFLGIRKANLKLLMERRGNRHLLSVLQMEKRMGQAWTVGQMEALAELETTLGHLETALSVMTLQKVLNLISKYAGCGYGTGCRHATEQLRHTATTYFDYLFMRAQLGYDLHNTVYQRPRKLDAAHARMAAEMNQKEQAKRLQEVDGKYPLIRKNYRKLRNRLFYQDENYLIRPARSAEEIVLEGRCLHHCVGGDNYLRKHNGQESLILMLRFREEPEIPYVTVELREECIVQWYGANDKKPDEKNIQRWLDAYVTRLKCGRLGVPKEPGQDDIQHMPA